MGSGVDFAETRGSFGEDAMFCRCDVMCCVGMGWAGSGLGYVPW